MNSHKHTESDSNHSSKFSGGVPTILSLSLSFIGLTPYAFHSLYLLTPIYHVLSPVRPYLPLSITKCSLSHHPFCYSLPLFRYLGPLLPSLSQAPHRTIRRTRAVILKSPCCHLSTVIAHCYYRQLYGSTGEWQPL